MRAAYTARMTSFFIRIAGSALFFSLIALSGCSDDSDRCKPYPDAGTGGINGFAWDGTQCLATGGPIENQPPGLYSTPQMCADAHRMCSMDGNSAE
jgi:hypothetical protein